MTRKSGNLGQRALLVLGVVALLVAAVFGSWRWFGDDGSTEQKARNDFCWSLVPGGKPEDGASTAECGAALETTMTGRPPGSAPPESTPEHDAERVRVLEEVVKGYAEHVEDDPEAMPEEIRRNMANALAFYADDIHDIIGLYGDFSTRELSTRPNDVDVDRATMADFIRGIAEDAEAFRTVRESQLALVAEGIRGLGREDFTEGSDEAQGVALVGGNTMGVLDRIGAEALGARHDDEAGRKEWIEAYGKQGTGGNPEVFFSPRRNSGYLEDMFRERADRLGALTEVPGNGDAGLHPKITEVIRTEYRTAS